jgi:hypothetical protein
MAHPSHGNQRLAYQDRVIPAANDQRDAVRLRDQHGLGWQREHIHPNILQMG